MNITSKKRFIFVVISALIVAFALTLAAVIPQSSGETALAEEVSVWDGSSDKSWYEDGLAEYDLNSAAQLKGFADIVNDSNGEAFPDYCKVNLLCDVDLNNLSWTPIDYFDGTFDGYNHTVSHMNVNRSDNQGAGFFGNCEVKAPSIQNFTLDNCTVVHTNPNGMAGVLFGYLYSGWHYAEASNYIRNCHVKNSSVSGTTEVGGLGGAMYYYISITDCSVENVTIAASTETSATAGIVSYAALCGEDLLVSNCSVVDVAFPTNTVANQNGIIIGYVAPFDGYLDKVAAVIDCSTNMFGNICGTVTSSGKPSGTRQVIEAFAVDGKDTKNVLSVSGLSYSGIVSEGNVLTFGFVADLSNVNVTVNGTTVTPVVEGKNLTVTLQGGTNTVSINLNSGVTAVSIKLIVGVGELYVNDTSAERSAAFVDGSTYCFDGTNRYKFVISAVDGLAVSGNIGGTTYSANNNVIDFGSCGSVEITLNVSFKGTSITVPMQIIELKNKIADGIYVKSNDASQPWILDTTITDSVAYRSAPGFRDATSSSVTFIILQKGKKNIQYAYSSEGGTWDYMSMYLDGAQVLQAGGNNNETSINELSWNRYTLNLGETSYHELTMTYQKDGSVGRGLDGAWLKDFTSTQEAAPVVEYVAVTVNYDDTLGSVAYGMDRTPVANGETALIQKNTKTTFFALPKKFPSSLDGNVMATADFQGYQVDIVGFSADAVTRYSLSSDVNMTVSFTEKALSPDTAIVHQTINGVSSETELPSGGSITGLDPDDNISFTIAVREYGQGEECYLSLNGGNEQKLLADMGSYYYVVQKMTDDINISIVYKKDGLIDSNAFTLSFKYNFVALGDINTELVSSTSLPLTIMNNSAYPFVYDEAHSGLGRIAFKSTNTSYGYTYSNIGFTASQQGILYFDYYVSSELGWDCAVYRIGAPVDYYAKDDGTNIVIGSGETGWKTGSIVIPANKTVYFAYIKDGGMDTGDDLMALANIRLIGGDQNVSFTSSNNTYGSVSATIGGAAAAPGAIGYSSEMTFNATPLSGGQFCGWYDGNGNLVTFDTSFTTTVVTDLSYQARFVAKGTYQAVIGNTLYTTFADAVAHSGNDSVIRIISDVTISENFVIPASMTVIIACNLADTTGTTVVTYYADAIKLGATSRVSWTDEAKYLVSTVRLNDDVVLTVNGTLVVGGVQHYPDQSAQGHTSGDYTQLINNGEVVVNGKMTVYGLVKGNGRITANHGAILKQPFLVNNYSGGTNTSALYNEGQFPFVQFATVNIQCAQTINYGARVYGMTSLFFWETVTTQDVVLVNKYENMGGDGSLIWMKQGSRLEITYDANKRINGNVGNINLTDSGVTTISVFGSIVAGEFYLQGYGSGSMVLAVPYTYNFVLNNGATVEIPSGRAYKLMPGAKITVNDGAEINLNGKFYVYDGLIQADKSGKSYPSAEKLKANGFDRSGVLIVNGTLNVNGTFAGMLQATEETGIINTAVGAVLSATLTDGCSKGYTDDTTVLSLAAKAYLYQTAAPVQIEAGKKYVSKVLENISSSFSVVSAARISALTSNVQQSLHGAFIEIEGENYHFYRTFYIGEAVEDVMVRLNGKAYTTNAEGKFTAELNVGSDFKVIYTTLNVINEVDYETTVSLDSEYITLNSILKSAELTESCSFEKIFDANGTLLSDYAFSANIQFYGGESFVSPAKYDESELNPNKAVNRVTVYVEEYPIASFEVELHYVSKAVSSYIALCDELPNKSSVEIVPYATYLYSEYGKIMELRDMAEREFLLARFAEKTSYSDYAAKLVKSATVTNDVKYGDSTAIATIMYIDGTTVEGVAINNIEYYLSGGNIKGNFRYTGSYAEVEYVVNVTVASAGKKPVTVTIDDKNSQYGEALLPLTFTTDVNAVGADDFNDFIRLSKTVGSNVNVYAITGTNRSPLYDVSFVDGEYTVSPRQIKVTVEKYTVALADIATMNFVMSQSNGGKASGFTYEIKKNGELIAKVSEDGTVSVEIGKLLTVGEYDIFPINYDENYVLVDEEPGILSVQKDNTYYKVTFAYGKDSGAIYDGSVISALPTVIIMENGDAVTDFAVKYTLGTESVSEIKGAGTYSVSVEVDGCIYRDAEKFVVLPKTAELSWTEPDFTYDASEHMPSCIVTNAVDGDDVVVDYDSFDCISAGKHTASVSAITGADKANYVLSETSYFDYYIKASKLIVSIDNRNSVYGDNFAALTYDLREGMLFGCVLLDIVEVRKEEGDTVGKYAITGSCIDSNYEIDFVDGIYEITARRITLAIDNKTTMYGDPFTSLTAVISEGTFANEDTVDDVCLLTKEEGSAVAKYAISGVSVNDNYDVAFVDGVYSVTKRNITVRINDASVFYGNTTAAMSAETIDGSALAEGDVLDTLVSMNREDGNAVGKYAITATKLDNANYNLLIVYTNLDHSVFEIRKRPITVRIENSTIDNTSSWEDVKQAMSYKISLGNVLPGENIDEDLKYGVVSEVSGVELTEVNFRENFASGRYILGAVCDSANYDVTVESGIITVTKRKVGVTGIKTQYVYTGEPLEVFDWKTNITNYLDRATDTSFKYVLSDNEGNAIEAITDVGIYNMTVSIVHRDYEFEVGAVTSYILIVSKKNVASDITVYGIEDKKVYSDARNISSVIENYGDNVALTAKLTRNNTEVTDASEKGEYGYTVSALGDYVYTVKAEGDNYTGTLTLTFRIVAPVTAKTESISHKLSMYKNSTGAEKLEMMNELRSELHNLTPDDYQLIASDDELSALLAECETAFEAFQRESAEPVVIEEPEKNEIPMKLLFIVSMLVSSIAVLLAIIIVMAKVMDKKSAKRSKDEE